MLVHLMNQDLRQHYTRLLHILTHDVVPPFQSKILDWFPLYIIREGKVCWLVIAISLEQEYSTACVILV